MNVGTRMTPQWTAYVTRIDSFIRITLAESGDTRRFVCLQDCADWIEEHLPGQAVWWDVRE